eukprot:3940661-Rhodomonas_salina.6
MVQYERCCGLVQVYACLSTSTKEAISLRVGTYGSLTRHGSVVRGELSYKLVAPYATSAPGIP